MLIWLGASGLARAESIVMLDATQGELGDGRARAERALARKLRAEGVAIITQPQAEARVGGAAASCTGPDCIADLARGSGADAALAMAIWSAAAPGEPGRLLVTLIDRKGQSFPGEAAIHADDVEGSAREALSDARSLQWLGPGPWLRVRSTPAGAQVMLDGRPLGATPTRAVVTPGRHTLEIRLPGLRPHAQTVDIPANASRQTAVEIDLTPRAPHPAHRRPAGEPQPRATRRPPAHPSRPLLGPLILGGIGVAIAAYDVIHIASDLCERRDAMGCAERSTISAGTAFALGGVAFGALGTGLLWYLLGESREPEPTLTIGHDRLVVHGRF